MRFTIRRGATGGHSSTIYEIIGEGRERVVSSCPTQEGAERIVAALEAAAGAEPTAPDALRWIEALEAWATNAMGIARDRRIPSADMIEDGEAILAGYRAALAGAAEPAAARADGGGEG